MAVYYKFKSAKDYDSIPLDSHFISVANLKEKIFETKRLGSGTDFDLVVANAQTNEEYVDDGMLIPKNTSVLIRRVPGRPRMPIVTAPVVDQHEPQVDNMSEDLQATKSSFLGADLSVPKYPEDSEWDEFGNDLYAIPVVLPVQSNNQVQDAPPPSKADEDSKIRALIDTPALDWQHQTADGFGRGFGRGMGGRMGGRGFGRGVGLERKTPPPGYVCHRCNVPGHFIQHCPTNGDPTFDIRRVKPPTGIPKSMLMATPDGSYALPSGAVAVLKPNEAAFEKEIEGMPSTRSVGDLPQELYCPLCGEVMKDAVLTSKCCFKSFCDKCIRNYIISKSICVCGAKNVLADDLLPNNTLRDTITRILEANNSSGENKGSAFQVQDMESKACLKPKLPSPTLSASSKGEQVLPQNKDAIKLKDTAGPEKIVDAPQPRVQNFDVAGTARVPYVSEAKNELKILKESVLKSTAPLAAEDLPQKLVSTEAGKKKKKKKIRVPSEMQWSSSQDFPADNYMMPMGPCAYTPCWNGMQPGMEGFGGPFPGPLPYTGYGLGPVPMDIPCGGLFPQDPYGPPLNMMPFPPQRNLAGYGMNFNGRPPVMSRDEFEARKVDLVRRRELERHGESRELRKERESREATSSSGVPSIKSKSKSTLPPRSHANQPRRHSRDPEPQRTSSARKAEYDRYNEEEHPRHHHEKAKHDHHNEDELPHRHHRQKQYEQYSEEESSHHHRLEKEKYEDYNEEKPPRHHYHEKTKYDHYSEEDHHHREKEHRHHRHHHRHHRSESLTSSKPPLRPASTDPPLKSSTMSDKEKRSVFSRISFPERKAEEAAAAKKRKTVSSSSPAASEEYHDDHHKSKAVKVVSKKSGSSTSGGNVEDRYQYGGEYESSEDDDRHFKRKPLTYVAVDEEKHSSRGSKEREKGSHSSKYSKSHSRK